MKRITLLLSFILAFCVFSYAQTLKIVRMGWNDDYTERIPIGDINPGDIIQIETDATTEEFEFDSDVTNVSGIEQMVSLTMVVSDFTEGIDISGCWEMCPLPWNFDFNPLAMVALRTEAFPIHYATNGIPNSKALIKCTFTVASDPEYDFTFFVKFGEAADAVQSPTITKNKAYPNPASSALNIDYSLNNNRSNAQITLYNILGVVVSEQKVSGNEGTVSINVTDFAQGVYFYVIKVDGKTIETKKIIIAR